MYSKPDSSNQRKSLLLDHISDAYNLLSVKYGRGLHFIIAGDTNKLKLDSILSLDTRFVQVVKANTRLNPPEILDPVIMTLSKFYREPEDLDPLDPDPDKNGVKSDHRIPLLRPIDVLNNKGSGSPKIIKVRPFPQSGIDSLEEWFIDQKWESVYEAQTGHKKAENFQKLLMDILNKIFPEKNKKIFFNDKPWMNFKLQKLDRKRKRIYNKQRRSQKFKNLDKKFKLQAKLAKKKFYKKEISILKSKKPGQWYTALKRLASFDQEKNQQPVVADLQELSDAEQAEQIAQHFAKIQNEYDSLKTQDISVPSFTKDDIPQIKITKVWDALSQIKINKGTVSGDFPAKFIKQFASYLAEPLTDIINTCISRGEYPYIYKFEVATPVPKVYPTLKVSQLRNISGLFNFDKIMEKILAGLMIEDMEERLDPTQYGNQKGISINHYLINMIHRILTVLDKNNSKEKYAIIASLVDWKDAFPHQCPKLGIESFIQNGVRPSLIPILINFFQDRRMTVKWHGQQSEPKQINGGGPQGATLGILEYLSQSNNNADMVSQKDRFKFVDDLTALEVVNLLSVGLTSYNIRQHVPSDIPTDALFIPSENLKSKKHYQDIENWTEKNKMKLNTEKTKNMIFNYTNNYQFTTRLSLCDEKIEVLKSTKLLGTIISDDLKWDSNTKEIVRKANMSMQILRKMVEFGATISEMKQIYFAFVRSHLEKSATLWHSSLTQKNINDLERVQKTAVKIILGSSKNGYKKGLLKLDIDDLKTRRKKLCLDFAKKCIKNPKLKNMFPRVYKTKCRKSNKYFVQYAKHERLKQSAIIYMQNLLNAND